MHNKTYYIIFFYTNYYIMAEETKVNPIFKEILLAQTANKDKDKFRSKIEEIDMQFYLLLEDYKRLYIASGLDKESNDLETAFLREKSMLETNKQNVFLLKNQIQSAYNKESDQIHKLEDILKTERRRLKINTKKEAELQGLDEAALQMLDDKNVAYNKKMITISNIVIGIIAMGFLIYKVPKGEHIL